MDNNNMEGVNDTLMSAETLISEGVRVMDGHCCRPSPMRIQERANSPWAHSFWMVQLEKVTDRNIGTVIISYLGAGQIKHKDTGVWWHDKTNSLVSTENLAAAEMLA